LARRTGYFTKLGIPAPSVAAPVVAAFELRVRASCWWAGFKTRFVALAIAVFVVIAALFAHTNFADANQLNHFMKNLAIAGGCLALFVSGAVHSRWMPRPAGAGFLNPRCRPTAM